MLIYLPVYVDTHTNQSFTFQSGAKNSQEYAAVMSYLSSVGKNHKKFMKLLKQIEDLCIMPDQFPVRVVASYSTNGGAKIAVESI